MAERWLRNSLVGCICGPCHGNPRLEAADIELVGNAITLSANGVVNAVAHGAVRLIVRSNAAGLIDTIDTGTVAAVPPATIAWDSYDSFAVTDLFGTAQKTIDALGTSPSWEPGGERFVAAHDGLIVVDADGTVHQLTIPELGAVLSPEWETDGDIYFTDRTADGHRLARIRPDGTGLESLIPDERASMPTVSPDATHLAYIQATLTDRFAC